MSRSRVCIVDYGVGNLQSIRNAIRAAVEEDLDLVKDPAELDQYEKLILPGVGAFGDAMLSLRNQGMEKPLLAIAASGKPLLGICVGMQILAEKGLEHGEHQGLGIIPGVVRPINTKGLPSIHMGWNDIQVMRDNDPLLAGVPTGTDFYFVHGYALDSTQEENVLATVTYGESFPVIVRHRNVWGVQFHPEKSQQQGLQILGNFVRSFHA